VSNRSLTAALFAAAMLLWLLSGDMTSTTLTAAESPAAVLAAEENKTPSVRGIQSTAAPKVTELSVRGLTQANRKVSVRAEVTGRIESLPAVKGTRVEKGDLLCKIAVDTRQIELNEARAQLQTAQLEYNGLIDLRDRGLQSEINIAKAKATLETMRANVRRAELNLQKTRITAPFAGIVNDQPVEEGDFLTQGGTCVTLIEIDPLLVTGQVAEKNISAVKLGDEVNVSLITGENLTGTLSFIAASPDPATRSYPIEVTVANPSAIIRAGLTSTLKVPLERQLAHLVSPGYFVLNDQGTIGVRTVDADNSVRFMPVNIIGEGPEGVWVTGLPNQVNIITVGQEEVFDGQIVQLDLTPLTSLVSY